ncbi:rod shape-determining protein MreD [Candidatus Omnitrophota bacterium]
MGKIIVLIIITVCSLLVMLNYPDTLTIFNLKPDFFIIILIFSSIYLAKNQSKVIILAGGLLKDVFTYGPFGMHIISFVVCGYVALRLKSYFYRERFLEQALFVFLISMVNVISVCILRAFFFQPHLIFSIFLKGIVESIFTSLIAPLMLTSIKKCVPRYS